MLGAHKRIDLKRSVFLLNLANFGLKTGGNNSYAPRVRLSDIFVRTRDFITYIANVQNQVGQVLPIKTRQMNQVASRGGGDISYFR